MSKTMYVSGQRAVTFHSPATGCIDVRIGMRAFYEYLKAVVGESIEHLCTSNLVAQSVIAAR